MNWQEKNMEKRNEFNCPVCNEELTIKKSEWTTELSKGGYYSDFLIKQGINSIGYYRCTKCKWIVAQPMLKRGSLDELYENIIPVHPHGKRNYEALKSSKFNKTMQRNKKIYEVIAAKNKTIDAYAEIGCPYQGFITNLTNKQTMKVEWNDITYLVHQEKEFWGKNCVLESRLCVSTIPKHVRKVELKNLDEENDMYNLIGIFNYIDHVENPLKLNNKLKNLSKNILLVTHDPKKSGPQHRYMLDEETLSSIFKDYGEVEILDIGDKFKEYIAALVERKK